MQVYIDNNIGVVIDGKMPPKLQTFSAKGVEFDCEDIDFSDCHDLTFLIYKVAGFKYGDTNELIHIKIGDKGVLRGDKAQ